MRPRIQLSEARHFDNNIDDWLGTETWNGGAPDVVNPNRNLADSLTNTFRFGRVLIWPIRVVRRNANDHLENQFATVCVMTLMYTPEMSAAR